MVGDGTWLTIGEVLAKLREAGFTDSESTVRRMIDDGQLRSHRTGKGHRRVRAASVDQLIAIRNHPEITPLDPDSPGGRQAADELSEVLARAALRLQRRDADKADAEQPDHDPGERP